MINPRKFHLTAHMKIQKMKKMKKNPKKKQTVRTSYREKKKDLHKNQNKDGEDD